MLWYVCFSSWFENSKCIFFSVLDICFWSVNLFQKKIVIYSQNISKYSIKFKTFWQLFQIKLKGKKWMLSLVLSCCFWSSQYELCSCYRLHGIKDVLVVFDLSIDPVNEVASLSIDSRVFNLGTTVTPGDNSTVDSITGHWATRVSLEF